MTKNYNYFFCLIPTLLLFACNASEPKDFENAQALFNRAEKLYEKKNYSEAAEYYESLIQRFSESPLVEKSELGLANAYFEQEEFIQAEFAYTSFKKLYPSHSKIPFVTLQIGKTHFSRARRSPARDQTHTRHALRYYNQVLSSWPGTPESEEALKLQKQARRRLVEQELYVGSFYQKQRKHSAAISRFKDVSQSFEDLYTEAQYKMAKSHLKLKQFEDAKKSLDEALKNPKSDYAQKAQLLRKQLK